MIHHFFTGTVLREKWLRYPLLKKVIDHVEINSNLIIPFFMIPCFFTQDFTHILLAVSNMKIQFIIDQFYAY